MIKGNFYIDQSGPFAGHYNANTKWNGFACPYFTKTEGENIVIGLVRDGIITDAKYDAHNDSFVCEIKEGV